MQENNISDAPVCPVRHIAFIMDGNGRWAKRRGLPRQKGHVEGAKAFDKIVHACFARGIEAVTVYAFSTENWSRPQIEVDAIMKLMGQYLRYAEKKLAENDVRIIFLGSKDRLSAPLRKKAEEIEEKSKDKTHILNIAFNYGGRDEILNAFRLLAAEGKTDITEEDISAHLYTVASPALDLVVRTGGDLRISNFLIWQSAYAEYYFTDTLWPDFSEEELDKALSEFGHRERRFGGVK